MLIPIGRRHNQHDVASGFLELHSKLAKRQVAAFVFDNLGLDQTQVDAVVGIEAGREADTGVTGNWGVLACAGLATFASEFMTSSPQFDAVDSLFRGNRIIFRAKLREVSFKGWFHRLTQYVDQTLKGYIDIFLTGNLGSMPEYCGNGCSRATSHGELCSNRMSQPVEVEGDRFL